MTAAPSGRAGPWPATMYVSCGGRIGYLSVREAGDAVNSMEPGRRLRRCPDGTVAHRLSTLHDADRIFVFEDGRLADTGTYLELLDRGGVFAELAHLSEPMGEGHRSRSPAPLAATGTA